MWLMCAYKATKLNVKINKKCIKTKYFTGTEKSDMVDDTT